MYQMPKWSRGDTGMHNLQSTTVVFVLDTSASMNAHGHTGMSFLDCAKLVRGTKLRARVYICTYLRTFVYAWSDTLNSWLQWLLLWLQGVKRFVNAYRSVDSPSKSASAPTQDRHRARCTFYLIAGNKAAIPAKVNE